MRSARIGKVIQIGAKNMIDMLSSVTDVVHQNGAERRRNEPRARVFIQEKRVKK